MTILTGALIGLLIGIVLRRARSDLLGEGLTFPLLVLGGLLVVSSQSPIEIVTALLVAAYVVTLTGARVHR